MSTPSSSSNQSNHSISSSTQETSQRSSHKSSHKLSQQSSPASPKPSWVDSMKAYLDPRAIIMLFLGFAAGIPILLIFSSLGLWLREAGIDRSTVTMFSWAALGYSFKFIWAPLIDAVPLPLLTAWLGKRRSWMLVAQIGVIAAILTMASFNPVSNDVLFSIPWIEFDVSILTMMAFGAVMLGFSSATQDIVIDAYRIELAPSSMQTILSAMYAMGYRIGMIVAGAGALWLADYFGSTKEAYSYIAWRNTYWIMAAIMATSIITTLVIYEPKDRQISAPDERSRSDYLRLVSVFFLSLVGFVYTFAHLTLPDFSDTILMKFAIEGVRLLTSLAVAVIIGLLLVQVGLVKKHIAFVTWIEPIADFFKRYGKKALLLLALIGLYRISDIVAGVISNVFYQDMGFTKSEIATAVKFIGMWLGIAGGFVGGLIAQRIPVMKAMMVGAILACVTNLLFVLLTFHQGDLAYMYLAVIGDNLAAGFASTVFLSFLSALTSIRFTAVQYAIFSSLMTLSPKILGGYSGSIVDSLGYPFFFTFCCLIGVPILGLVYLVNKHMDIGELPEDNAKHANKSEPGNAQ